MLVGTLHLLPPDLIPVVCYCLLLFLSPHYPQLYRDCLRLIRHVAPGGPFRNAKARALQETVKAQFAQHRNETDPDKILTYKADAVRALSNYLLATSIKNDPKVRAAAQDFQKRSVQEAKQEQRKPPKTP